MAAIKYERELLNYLQSCKKKPTTAGIWSAAIEFMEAKFSAANKQSTPFIKCDDCNESAEYHYCSECMDNYRN